jgi:hypothetical protein
VNALNGASSAGGLYQSRWMQLCSQNDHHILESNETDISGGNSGKKQPEDMLADYWSDSAVSAAIALDVPVSGSFGSRSGAASSSRFAMTLITGSIMLQTSPA